MACLPSWRRHEDSGLCGAKVFGAIEPGMSDTVKRDSLLSPSQGQMELIPSDQLPDVLFFEQENPSDGSPREFTAARFFKKHPEEYMRIVALLAEEEPIERLTRRFNVGKHTIYAIINREMAGAIVARLKQQASTRYRGLARLGSDVLREVLLMDEAKLLFAKSPEKLAILIGVLEDKAELLSGGSTQRIEIVDQTTVYRDMLNQARAMIGCGGDVSGQKDVDLAGSSGAAGADPVAAARVIEVESTVVTEGAREEVSDDKHE